MVFLKMKYVPLFAATASEMSESWIKAIFEDLIAVPIECFPLREPSPLDSGCVRVNTGKCQNEITLAPATELPQGQS